MSQLALTENERRVLARVEQQHGRANWHSVAVLLGPIDESPVALLRELARRCLARELTSDAAMTHYEITALGRVALHGREASDELLLLAEAIAAGPALLVELFVDVVADWHVFAAALGRIFDDHPVHRRAVALGLDYLPAGAPERVSLARRFFDEPTLLLEAWCPPRLHFLGEIDPLLPDPHWDELLARGLADPAPATRHYTAALIFATDRGSRFASELLALLPEAHLDVVLALAGASDPASLVALVTLLDGTDSARAATAARALAERPDGEAAFARALEDHRAEVRNAASFAKAVRGRGRGRG